MIRTYLALAGLLALAGAFWWAYERGYDRGEAHARAEVAEATRELQERLARMSDEAAELARRLVTEQLARGELERRLADEAANDPLGDTPGLGAGSLQRLDQIR